MIKSRRMKGERHVAHIGTVRNVCKVLVIKPEVKEGFSRRTLLDGVKLKP
jgi:hypothetical protein